jgi:hypothetical protein
MRFGGWGGAGGTVLALTGVYSLAKESGMPLDFLNSPYFFYPSVALVIVGTLMVVIWIIEAIYRHMFVRPAKELVRKWRSIFQKAANKFSIALCEDADIPEVTRVASSEYGAAAASIDRNRHLRRLDDMSYFKVVDRPTRTIVGMYCIFRLSSLGKAALLRGEFDIKSCPRRYFRKDKKYQDVDVYIGGIYGINAKAEAYALGAVAMRLESMQPRTAFARAATEDGLRLLTDHDFEPVKPGEEGVGELYMKKQRSLFG